MFNQPKKNKNKGGEFHFSGQTNERFNQKREIEDKSEFRQVSTKQAHRTEFIRILKRMALISGLLVASISILFTYIGLNRNSDHTGEYGQYIPIIILIWAIVISLIQFIFNTDFGKLPLTLKIIGGVSYIYSIRTNFTGLDIMFNFDLWTLAGMSFLMDVYPEAAIAWALEEVTQGDFLGNLGKLILGTQDTGHTRQYQIDTDLKNRIGH